MATSGQKPGSGVYICNNYGKAIRVDERKEPLPSCPKCKGTDFTPQTKHLQTCHGDHARRL